MIDASKRLTVRTVELAVEQPVTQPLSDRQRREVLFRGDLLVYRQLPALLTIKDQLHHRIAQALGLGLSDPPSFFQSQPSVLQRQALTALQEEIRADHDLRQQFYQVLQAIGLDPETSFSDTLQLRAVGPASGQKGRDRGAISHHRDTWGSNIQAQVNWWTPLYPITLANTITFYPDYWDQPLPNSSAEWSFEEFLARRAATPADQPLEYPYAPQPLEAIDEQRQQPIVIEPGDLLCFASAHLHGSTLNTTDQTRFNLEMRTVTLADLSCDSVPANLDNAGEKPMYHWFKRLSDQRSLKKALAD